MNNDKWVKLVGIFTILGAIAALLMVPEVRKFLRLDSSISTQSIPQSQSQPSSTDNALGLTLPKKQVRQPRVISTAILSPPHCVVSYTSGCCWTITPPTSPPCSGLPSVKPSVAINSDASTCTLIVPANIAAGVRAVDPTGRQFSLHQGDQFEIRAEGLVAFSYEHPCVGPEGMIGWYDPYMDSPFKQNVGGLEFSIGSLSSNRFFAGEHYYGTAEYSGTPIFRIVERTAGYNDDNFGSFAVTIHRISR